MAVGAVAADPREELLAELVACPLATYAAVCLNIRLKAPVGGKMIVPLHLNLAQSIVEEHAERQREQTARVRQIILKARQEGISTGVAARYFRKAHLIPDLQGLIVADLKKRSETLWQIYDRYYNLLPKALQFGKRRTRHLQNLALENGSQIQVETAEDIQAGRSMTIQLAHLSEVAFWEHPEEAWTALSEAIPMEGSEIILESTANGVGNFFHRFWEEAEQGRSAFEPIFLPWWIHEGYTVVPTEEERASIEVSNDPWERRAMDHGIAWEGRSWAIMEELAERFGGRLDSGAVFDDGAWRLSVGQLAWRRRKIADKLGDERAFRQENPAWPEEAFLASGNQFLEEALLERLRRGARPPYRRGNLVRVDAGLAFLDSESGDLRVWDEPDLAHHYVIGVDTASGRQVGPSEDVASEHGGSDFSCAQVIRLAYQEGGAWHPARKVAELHCRAVPEVFAAYVWDLGMWYSCPRPGSRTLRHPALIGVERNHSSGETVLRFLDDSGYPELYVHSAMNRTYGRPSRMLGWSTDATTRQPMLDEWAAALRMGELEDFSAELARECRTFVRGEDGKPQAQEGTHDDRIMAEAIAWQMTRWHPNHGSAMPEEPFRPGKGPARW